MFQRSQFEPTWMNFSISSAGNNLRKTFEYVQNIASYKIHDLPPSPAYSDQDYYCETTGSVFNPKDIESKNLPPPGFGTQDQYFLGDLSGKLHGRNRMEIHNYLIPDASNELNGVYWDIFMPLYGRHSIVNRGLVLNKYNRTDPQNVTETKLGCGTFSLYEDNKQYQLQIQTAQVLFRYPIVGKILFRQPKDQPWQDTTIIVEYLIHADGANLNNSDAHRWAISLNPPGKDFYSWQNRCISAGEPFNPYKVSFDMKSPGKTCGSDSSELCRMGDLARLDTLGIAGAKVNAQKISRRIFTDSNLPLSGFSSIIGKSVVIYSDKGPVARGERLACSM